MEIESALDMSWTDLDSYIAAIGPAYNFPPFKTDRNMLTPI